MLALAGCNSSPTKDAFSDLVDGLHAKRSPLRGERVASRSLTTSYQGMSGFAGASHIGSGSFVSGAAPGIAAKAMAGGGQGFELNLVNAPIAEAAKAVLGDILGVNYVLDPRVTGTVTLQTSAPVSREALTGILEAALAVNNATIVNRGGVYQIVPLSEALSATPAVSVPSVSPSGPGVKVQVIELQHVAADEIRTILEPISRQGSILRTDSERNYIMIAGNSADLAAMREAISVFDVDWMRGMSVAIHPLKTSDPGSVAQELNTIFGVEGGSSGKSVRFIPNKRLNAVLVIASRPTYLSRAASWIEKLDRIAHTNDDQLFVYEIQNRPAKELAEVLRSVLAGGTASGRSASRPSVSPDLSPTLVAADNSFDIGLAERMGSEQASAATAFASAASNVMVTADVENNALLVQTTAREYQRVEGILHQLDVLPTQVLLEAVIAEVTLTDELKFGLRWFFENGNFSVSLSDVASGFVGAAFPGFAWSYATNDVKVTLNALSSVTDVNVVSAPTLMALNNQKAVLQVGDQVPIVTQQSVGTDAPGAPIVNSVEMKDTGVILSVTPRVNSSGRVMLDIEQEASSVVKTTTSGIDSPTIQQRKISTRVLVNDGESIALGGLIQEKNSLSRGQVPILGDIPLIGNAFKNKTDAINRTELIIFIRPRVVRNIQEARSVTAEFRERLQFESPIARRRGGRNRLEQDVKRLIH
ncbi:type II secretion system secretin GspD [Nitratireductor sp. ZSWI3]|uniref:type II secretion system secretin GspD n=1 Tax=Nitratireductor sp. ZSWI3 TaxID=2966359 RepID=UPI0021504D9E|nr:type II secretion system secretin GspD [Nitratireductor sp. ZSWI3]MCR4265781.1 type II secretion system secretin GspD [Nitratireductor sp. ZSWI3]